MRPIMIMIPPRPPKAIPTIVPVEMPDELVDDDVPLEPDPELDPDPDDPILGLGPPPPTGTVGAVDAAVNPLTWDGVAAAWLIPPLLE